MKKFFINVKIRLAVHLIYFFVALSGAVTYVHPQSPKMQFRDQKPILELPKTIFNKIEEGIALKDIEKFSQFLGSQTYLSLPGSPANYYGSSQAFYILQDYFRIYKPINFRFLTINEKSDNPYASGYYRFESKGVRGTAQIYISLKLIGNNWKISQITIN